jgi:Na+/melibiose symporter-like transporter
VCYLGFLEGDGEEVVMWKLPRSDFPLAATICLVAVNSILLLLIIFFSVKHWLRRAKAREARRREKAATQRLLRGLNTPPDLDDDTD